MELQLINGKWTLNNKTYVELFGAERGIFEVLMSMRLVKELINKKKICR